MVEHLRVGMKVIFHSPPHTSTTQTQTITMDVFKAKRGRKNAHPHGTHIYVLLNFYKLKFLKLTTN